ncbi:MAG: GNAT family N-acetyltransferase [Pseudomonadota bacterium]
MLAALFARSRAVAMPWLPVLHTPEEDVAFFKDRVLPRGETLIAEAGAEVAAFITFNADFVDQLYVEPERRRQGLGRALLREAKSSSDSLSLWVFQQNSAARAFYAAEGFVDDIFTDGSNNEEKTPDLRMVWQARSKEHTQ